MGFKDGTNNIKAEDSDQMRRFVWLGNGDRPAWMRNGTFMVTRRIRMLLEVWDRSTLRDQQQTIGRRKGSGAPLTGRNEFDHVDLGAKHGAQPVIGVDAHVRLAAPSSNSGERMLRRGYSFTDGVVEESGELDAGLFFILPARPRAPVRRRAATPRNLRCPERVHPAHGERRLRDPAGPARPGGYVGQTLLG